MTRALIVGLLALAGLVTLAPSAAAGGRVGAAVVVGSDFTTPLDHGNSKTTFSLSLPNGASCPHDSIDGNYRVQSFIVPAAADVMALHWIDVGPQHPHAWGLFMADTNAWVNEPTQKAETKGGKGLIVNIPPFVFSSFSPGDIPAGKYKIGVACTLFGKTQQYWSTNVVMRDDPQDHPAQIAWSVVDPPARHASKRGATLGLTIAVFGGLLVLGLLVRRRNHTEATPA